MIHLAARLFIYTQSDLDTNFVAEEAKVNWSQYIHSPTKFWKLLRLLTFYSESNNANFIW